MFGPHDFRSCSATRWSPGDCLNPLGYIKLATSWSNKTGSTTYNRSGRTVKMYAVALNYTTSVSYARVVVTYGILK